MHKYRKTDDQSSIKLTCNEKKRKTLVKFMIVYCNIPSNRTGLIFYWVKMEMMKNYVKKFQIKIVLIEFFVIRANVALIL